MADQLEGPRVQAGRANTTGPTGGSSEGAVRHSPRIDRSARPVPCRHPAAILASDVGAMIWRSDGKGGQGEQKMSSGIKGIADDFEKRLLQLPATAPIVDMVALESVLMAPVEEPPVGLDRLAVLIKALPYADMLALGASIWAANAPGTRLTQEILPQLLHRWALTMAPRG